MIDSKPWFASRTVWASLVTIVLAMANYAGVATEGLQPDMLTDATLNLATTIAGIVALLGRLQATSRIG
ncbi:MAG: hypothetical protein KF874_05755 [Rhizobiaceae bacterium]|nr:hypothetical protein [Rhizobiaceae bacterium]